MTLLPVRRCLIAVLVFASKAEAVAPYPPAHLAAVENEPLIDQVFPIVKEAYSRTGISAFNRKLLGERTLAMLNSGEFFGDVAHVEGLEKYYGNMVRVPVPLIHFDAVAFTVRRDLTVHDWSSLTPYHVCIRRGIKAIELATAGMKNLFVVSTYEQIFAMLKVRRCDVAVLPRQAWIDIGRLSIKGIRSSEPPLQTWPMYHYVHKSHAAIVPLMTRELRAMQKSGELQKKEDEFWSRVEDARRASMD